jgi:hypothetical protein
VNESTDVLQIFQLSKLCDSTPHCYLGSDEQGGQLKCTRKFFLPHPPQTNLEFLS